MYEFYKSNSEDRRMSDDDKVVHVTFNTHEQTEVDKITFELAELLAFDYRERKQYVEDFLTMGYDEFTAFKLANQLCKSSDKNIT